MKRSKFEEILDSAFRWPAAGDAPFVADPDLAANANIASDDFARFVFMTAAAFGDDEGHSQIRGRRDP